MKYIVALTGGIGSGKSTVANIFAKLGINIIDSDVIARQILHLGGIPLHTISQYFGYKILNFDGSLNRAILRKRIFSNLEEKKWLNNLIHPLIQHETEKHFRLAQSPYILWVVPLLIENKLQNIANRILVVDVNRHIQLKRTSIRDIINYKQIENILSAQVLREVRLNYADDVIDNNGCFNKITERVLHLHNIYISLVKHC